MGPAGPTAPPGPPGVTALFAMKGSLTTSTTTATTTFKVMASASNVGVAGSVAIDTSNGVGKCAPERAPVAVAANSATTNAVVTTLPNTGMPESSNDRWSFEMFLLLSGVALSASLGVSVRRWDRRHR